MIAKKIVNMLAISLGVVVAALALNSYLRAGVNVDRLSSSFQMAVFVKKDAKVAPEVLKDQLLGVDNVKDVVLVDAEAALKQAINTTPSVGEIVLTNENPFAAYYVLSLEKITDSQIRDMQEKISAFKGIDEVRYDKNVIEVVEKLDSYRAAIKFIAGVVAICAILVLLTRFVLYFFKEEFQWQHLGLSVLFGLFSGLVGQLIYGFSLKSRYVAADMFQMPANFTLLFLTCGLVFTLMLDSD